MKKSYKKRSRKRSTKKRARRARRRTKKAGAHSELAKAVMKRQFQKRALDNLNTPGVISSLQALPLDNPDADYADALVMRRMSRAPQHIGMAGKRKAAIKEYRKTKRRKIDHPQAIKMTGSFSLGKRTKEGDKRNRKTRRRARRIRR